MAAAQRGDAVTKLPGPKSRHRHAQQLGNIPDRNSPGIPDHATRTGRHHHARRSLAPAEYPPVRQSAGSLIPTIDPDHPGVTSAKTLIELSASTVVCGVKLHCSAAPFDTPNDERRVDGDTPWERRMARSGRGQIPRQFTRLGDRDRVPGPAGGDGGGRRLRHRGGRRAATQRDVRYRPATLTQWVSSINQVHAAADLDPPGRSELVRRALAGIRRIRGGPAGAAGAAAVGGHPGLVDWLEWWRGLAGGGGRPPRHRPVADGVRRRLPPPRVDWPDGGRRDLAPRRRAACPAPHVQDGPGEHNGRIRSVLEHHVATGLHRRVGAAPQQFRQTTRPARRGSGSGDRPRASIVGGTSMWVAKAAATLAAAADPMT